MKTIGYQDIAGGSIYCFQSRKEPKQSRQERIKEAFHELRHTGRINVFLIDGKKARHLFTKGY